MPQAADNARAFFKKPGIAFHIRSALASLAVDHRAQGIKLGVCLPQDAVHRAVAASRNAEVRALPVQALHNRAKQFYEHHGFQESPQHPMTLMLRLSTLQV